MILGSLADGASCAAADGAPHAAVVAGWDFWYVAITVRPFVAVKRPMPRQALVMQRYRAGALVYALQDCGGFVVSAVLWAQL